MEDNTHESRSEWTIRQRLVCRSTYRARNWSTQRRATGARDKLVTAGKALWLVLKECRVKRTSDTTQTRYVYVPLYACTGTSRDARDAFMHGTVDTDARYVFMYIVGGLYSNTFCDCTINGCTTIEKNMKNTDTSEILKCFSFFS